MTFRLLNQWVLGELCAFQQRTGHEIVEIRFADGAIRMRTKGKLDKVTLQVGFEVPQ